MSGGYVPTWAAEVDGDGDLLWYGAATMDPRGRVLTADDLRCEDVGFGDRADEAFAALVAHVRDAARLRSLAARLDRPLNRDKSFTGAEVAAMLRDGKE